MLEEIRHGCYIMTFGILQPLDNNTPRYNMDITPLEYRNLELNMYVTSLNYQEGNYEIRIEPIADCAPK